MLCPLFFISLADNIKNYFLINNLEVLNSINLTPNPSPCQGEGKRKTPKSVLESFGEEHLHPKLSAKSKIQNRKDGY